MIRRNTWILIAVLLVLIGVGYYLQYRKSHPDASSATPTTTAQAQSPLIPVDTTQVASLRVQDASGKSVMITRDASGLWTLAEPTKGPADQASVEAAITQVGALKASATTMNPVSDLSIYGLKNYTYTITISLNGGQKYTVFVGDTTPTGDGYYVKVNDGGPQVVSKYSLDAILGLVKTPPYPPTPTPTVTATGAAPAATATAVPPSATPKP